MKKLLFSIVPGDRESALVRQYNTSESTKKKNRKENHETTFHFEFVILFYYRPLVRIVSSICS